MAENNNTVKLGAAVVLLLAAAGLVAYQMAGGAPQTSAGFFYDLETGKRFASQLGGVPPIDAPSGPGNGVRAEVFACGSCDDADAQFIGWLERYPADAKQQLVSLIAERAAAADENTELTLDERIIELRRVLAEVRTVDGGDWVNSQSPQADAIYDQVNTRCTGDAKLARCRP